METLCNITIKLIEYPDFSPENLTNIDYWVSFGWQDKHKTIFNYPIWMNLPAFDTELWFDCGCADTKLELGDEWLFAVAGTIFDCVKAKLGIGHSVAIDEFTNCGKVPVIVLHNACSVAELDKCWFKKTGTLNVCWLVPTTLLKFAWLCSVIACDGWFIAFVEQLGRSAVAETNCWSSGWLSSKPV